MTRKEFAKMVTEIVKKYNTNKKELTQYEIGILTKLAYGAKYEDFKEVTE